MTKFCKYFKKIFGFYKIRLFPQKAGLVFGQKSNSRNINIHCIFGCNVINLKKFFTIKIENNESN